MSIGEVHELELQCWSCGLQSAEDVISSAEGRRRGGFDAVLYLRSLRREEDSRTELMGLHASIVECCSRRVAAEDESSTERESDPLMAEVGSKQHWRQAGLMRQLT